MLIHLCDYASQPDIRIKCSQEWTTPHWPVDKAATEVEGVYLADNGLYYTFNTVKANCEKCKGT